MDDELRQAQERRLDALEAMATALSNLPALLAIVTSSADAGSAVDALVREFGVSPHNAVAILDLQVRRMSEEGRARIIEERDALLASLAEG